MRLLKVLIAIPLLLASIAQAKFTSPTQTTFSALNSKPGTAPNSGAYFSLAWDDRPSQETWDIHNQNTSVSLYKLTERRVDNGSAPVAISLANQYMYGQGIVGKSPGTYEYVLNVLACTSKSGCWYFEPIGGRITITVVAGALSSSSSSSSSSIASSVNNDAALNYLNYALQPSNTVGATTYSASVDHKGQANISVPIVIPEGINGMHPLLNISFNSAVLVNRYVDKLRVPSSGWLGYGWGVNGISTISRCTIGKINEHRYIDPFDKTKGTFETRPRVKYDYTDSLCLDGEQLMLVSGEYLKIGSQYRTRLDSFRLITMKGAVDTAPWFEVRNPNGSVSVYGSKDTSMVRKRSASHLNFPDTPYFLWAIDSETDSFGNQISYGYFKDESFSYQADKQRIFPSKITYPQGTINFVYHAKDTTTPLNLYGLVDEGVSAGIDRYRYNFDASVQLKAVVVRRKNDSDYKVYKIVGASQTTSEVRGSGIRPQVIQECSVSTSSFMSACLQPISIGWGYDSNVLDYRLLSVIDSNGSKTEFEYSYVNGRGDANTTGVLNNGVLNPFRKSTNIWRNKDDRTYVVSSVIKSNGLSNDVNSQTSQHRLLYHYHGAGVEDIYGKGFLGFAAIAITDLTANTSVIRQYSKTNAAIPGSVTLVAEHNYAPNYLDANSILISKTEYKPGLITFDYATGRKTFVSTVDQIASFNYEAGNLIGVELKQNTYNVDQNRKVLTSLVSTTTSALKISNPDFVPLNWGDYPIYSMSETDKKRTSIERTTMASVTNSTDWRIGYKTKIENRYYSGAVGASGVDEKIQTIDYTVKPGTTLVETETRFNGDLELQLKNTFGYDVKGRRSSVTTTGANIESRTTDFDFTSNNLDPDSVTNAQGHVTRNSDFDRNTGLARIITDPNGLVSRKEFDSFGRIASETDVNGVVSNLNYLKCNACISVTTKLGFVYPAYFTESTSSISPKVTSYYDILGREVKKVVEGFAGELIHTDTLYDELGRVYRTSLPYKNGETRYFVTNIYDARGRLVEQQNPDGGINYSDYSAEFINGEWWQKVTSRQLIKRSDGTVLRTDVKTSYFNAAGYLVRTIDAVGTAESVTTSYVYDALGYVINTLVSGGSDGSSTSSAVYDRAGNRTQITDPNAGTVTSKYNSLGQLRESKDAKGTVITMEYDKLGRMTKRTSSLDGIHQWFYDPAQALGGLSYVTNNNGYTQRYIYQDPGRSARLSQIQTEITVPDLGTRTFNEYVTYDAWGRTKKSTSPSGIAVSQQYNERGYVSRFFRDEWYPISTITKFGVFGIEEQTFPGSTKKATYDPKSGRMLTQTSMQGTAYVQNLTYKWLTNGSLQSKSDGKQAAILTETYAYDPLDRLTSASLTGGSSTRTTNTVYSRLGNIKSNTSTNSTDVQLSGYQYTSGRPHAVSSVIINGASTTLSYDVNGAITGYDSTGTERDKFIRYNSFNQPVTIVSGSTTDSLTANVREEFRYSPDGDRYYKKSSYLNAGQRYVEHTYYIGNYEATFYDVKSPVLQSEKSIFGDFHYIKRTPRSGAATEIEQILHRDYQGTITALTQGTTRTQLAFEPFGGRRNPTTLTSNLGLTELNALLAKADVMTFNGYTGHETLDRTGLIHMNGRVYDPQLARFISPDPLVQAPAYSQSWNRYSYAFNNPMKYTDPSGYSSQPVEQVTVTPRDGCNEVCQRKGYTTWYYTHAEAINTSNARWEAWGGQFFNVASVHGELALAMAQGISLSQSTIKPGGGSKTNTNNVLGVLSTSGTLQGFVEGAIEFSGILDVGSAAIDVYVSVDLGNYGELTGIAASAAIHYVTKKVKLAESLLEQTPFTNPELYKNLKGCKAKCNIKTGEIWEKDLLHKNQPHYEVYSNRKAYDKGKRSRAVWEDGRIKEDFNK